MHVWQPVGLFLYSLLEKINTAIVYTICFDKAPDIMKPSLKRATIYVERTISNFI